MFDTLRLKKCIELNKHLMTGPKGNSEFCFPETLNVPRGEGEENIDVEGPVMCFVTPPDLKLEHDLVGWRICIRWLRSQNVVPKRHDNKDSSKVSFEFSNAQLENSGFDLTRNNIFCCNDTTIFLPGDSDRRASCRTLATHFWRQIESVEIQNVQIFPLLIWHAFAITNPFSWLTNAVCSEKRCPTSMTFLSVNSGRLAHKFAAISRCTTWSVASRKFKLLFS